MGLLSKLGRVARRGAGQAMQRALERSPAVQRLADRVVERMVGASAPPAPAQTVDLSEEQERLREAHEGPLADAAVAAQIYGRGTCADTGRALELLERHDIPHAFVDLEDDLGAPYGPRLAAFAGRDHTPYVFLRGQLVGGYAELSALEARGELTGLG